MPKGTVVKINKRTGKIVGGGRLPGYGGRDWEPVEPFETEAIHDSEVG